MTSLPWPPLSLFIIVHLSPQQKYPRIIPELLTAVAALFSRQQLGDVLVLLNAYTIQQVAHVEFWMLEQLGYELATLTPMGWVGIFRRRFSLRQQSRPQSNSLTRLQQAVSAEALAVVAYQVAAAQSQVFPFCLTSTASQIGAAAGFVSVLFWWRLSLFLALGLPPVRSHLLCGQPRLSTLLLPSLVLVCLD